VLFRGGYVDIRMLWYWQWLWQGLYNIISALPDWAELNEFHVITGSVCKQPRAIAETTAWASISRSFSLFQSLPFIPSLAHLCSINRVDGDSCTHTHTHTHTYTYTHTNGNIYTIALSHSLSCSQFFSLFVGVSLRSDVFKGISFSELFFSSSPYLDILSVLLCLFLRR